MKMIPLMHIFRTRSRLLDSCLNLGTSDFELKAQGVETCNSYMFALSDAREFLLSQVLCLEREEKITDQSNFINDVP